MCSCQDTTVLLWSSCLDSFCFNSRTVIGVDSRCIFPQFACKAESRKLRYSHWQFFSGWRKSFAPIDVGGFIWCKAVDNPIAGCDVSGSPWQRTSCLESQYRPRKFSPRGNLSKPGRALRAIGHSGLDSQPLLRPALKLVGGSGRAITAVIAILRPRWFTTSVGVA